MTSLSDIQLDLGFPYLLALRLPIFHDHRSVSFVPESSVSALLIELGRWLDQELEGMPIRVTKFFLKRVSEPTTFPTIP